MSQSFSLPFIPVIYPRPISPSIIAGVVGIVFSHMKELWIGTQHGQWDAFSLSEFSRECGILHQLSHPNIVRFYGISKDQRRTYLVNASTFRFAWNILTA
jgi:serine/threonine protein kinase